MTDHAPTPNSAPAPAAPTAPVEWSRLPAVLTPLGTTNAMDRLRTASKRGRMPGFQPLGADTFVVELFGHPWDRTLVGTIRPEGVGSRLTFAPRSRRFTQILWAVILIATVWPGVILTDTLIPSSWGWIGQNVWTWYLPLTILANLWTWIWAVKNTEKTTRVSAAETIPAVATEVGGRTEP
jgi:hypothetical protein